MRISDWSSDVCSSDLTHRDLGSITHSLRVAAGLDSMVVGEPQILGQMKDSYALASEIKSIGPVLSRLFQHSFSVAKLVRSQTQVGAHPVSVAYAALQMAQRIFADLKEIGRASGRARVWQYGEDWGVGGSL